MIIKIKIAEDVEESHAVGFVHKVIADRKTPGTVVGIFLQCHIDHDGSHKTFVVERVRPIKPKPAKGIMA